MSSDETTSALAPYGSRAPDARMPLDQFKTLFSRLSDNIEKAVKGKQDVIRHSLVCVLAEGHLLIEDVPGVGKTSLARSIAASFGGACHRIQFTPDLLPSDITGNTVYDRATQRSQFKPGPVFANVVIADEINRASPKTQSALLEVMEERHVTVGTRREAVPSPFFVVATQNPVDMEGTYSLPEAQLDRFLMRLAIGYPDRETEQLIAASKAGSAAAAGLDAAADPDALKPVISPEEIKAMIKTARSVYCAENVAEYAVDIVAATREHSRLRLGASPRGSIALLRSARVLAAASGNKMVVPDDIQKLAQPVLAHRLLLTAEAEFDGRSTAEVLAEVMEPIPVPNEPSAVAAGGIGA